MNPETGGAMGASATKHGMKRLGSSPIRSDSFCSIVANIFIHHHATAGY